MHTTTIAIEEHTVRIIHNGDWSGGARVDCAEEGCELYTCATIPGWLAKWIFVHGYEKALLDARLRAIVEAESLRVIEAMHRVRLASGDEKAAEYYEDILDELRRPCKRCGFENCSCLKTLR